MHKGPGDPFSSLSEKDLGSNEVRERERPFLGAPGPSLGKSQPEGRRKSRLPGQLAGSAPAPSSLCPGETGWGQIHRAGLLGGGSTRGMWHLRPWTCVGREGGCWAGVLGRSASHSGTWGRSAIPTKAGRGARCLAVRTTWRLGAQQGDSRRCWGLRGFEGHRGSPGWGRASLSESPAAASGLPAFRPYPCPPAAHVGSRGDRPFHRK